MKALNWTPSSDWAEQLDFAGPRVRTAWWAWGGLLLALLALGALADRADHVSASREEAQAQLKRLERADRRQRLERALSLQAAPSSDRPLTPAPVLQGPAVEAAAQLAMRLSYPWAEVMLDMETRAAQERVVLLGMSLDLSSLKQPLLRAQGAVQNDAAALRWAASLPQGQLLGRQALGSAFVGSQGSYALKADVQAAWTASADERRMP